MIPALARFVDALRAAGSSVSPAEAVDAARALEAVGLERRALVKAALGATLAKDRAARARFDRLFDRFFVPPRIPREGRGKERPGRSATGRSLKPSEEEPRAGRRPGEDRPRPSERKASPRERPAEAPRRRLVVVRRARDPHEAGTAPAPARRELTRRMTTDEERAVAREVPALIAALRLRTGRRRAKSSAGRPWLRRAMRESLATGGVPFVVPRRRTRPRGSRVVLLVDVSHSVARAAGLFVWMASAFLELGRGARILAFVDRPVDVTGVVARWGRGRAPERPPETRQRRHGARAGEGIVRNGVSFADLLDRVPGLNLQAPSDYGRALHALLAPRLRPRGRQTVLVVLGDGRTNAFEPLPWALEDASRGCRAVIWLAPEPASRWGTGDSALPAYLAAVDVLVEATDLEGLARGLVELRRRM